MCNMGSLGLLYKKYFKNYKVAIEWYLSHRLYIIVYPNVPKYRNNFPILYYKNLLVFSRIIASPMNPANSYNFKHNKIEDLHGLKGDLHHGSNIFFKLIHL